MMPQNSKILEKKSLQKEVDHLLLSLEKNFPTSEIKIKQTFEVNELTIDISFLQTDYRKNISLFFNFIQVYVGKIWNTSSKLILTHRNRGMEERIVINEPFSSTYLGKINEDQYIQLEEKSFSYLMKNKNINDITLVIKNIKVSNTLVEYFKKKSLPSTYSNILSSMKSILSTQETTLNGLSIENLNKHLSLNYLIYQYKDFIQSVSTALKSDNHICSFYTLSKNTASVIGILIKRENDTAPEYTNLISHLMKEIFDYNIFQYDREYNLLLCNSNSTDYSHYLDVSELYSFIAKRKKENTLPLSVQILNEHSYKIQITNEDECYNKHFLLILRSIALYLSIRNSDKVVITITNNLGSFSVDITKLNDKEELSKIYKIDNCITIETYIHKKSHVCYVKHNSNDSTNILQNNKESSSCENITIKNHQYSKKIKQKLLLMSVTGVILFFIYFIPSELVSSYEYKKKLYIILPLITTTIILLYTAYELNKFNTQIIEPIFHELKMNSEYKL